MKHYFLAGLKMTVLTLALSAAALAILGLLTLTLLTAAEMYIDGSIFLSILQYILGAVVLIFTAALILAAREQWLESLREWMREAKADMSWHRHQKLKERISGMKAVYRKYNIYPKLKIYQDYDNYYYQ